MLDVLVSLGSKIVSFVLDTLRPRPRPAPPPLDTGSIDAQLDAARKRVAK